MRLLLSAAVFATVLAGAAVADDAWVKFSSKADGFSVEFPGAPTTHEPLPLFIDNVTIATRTYSFDQDKDAYLVSVATYSNKLFVSNPQLYLDTLVREQTKDATVDSNAPIEIDGNPGREAVFETADGDRIRAKEIFASGTLYQIVFREKGKDHDGSHPDAKRFLKSFRLIPASD